jgi:hypothetical protein
MKQLVLQLTAPEFIHLSRAAEANGRSINQQARLIILKDLRLQRAKDDQGSTRPPHYPGAQIR